MKGRVKYRGKINYMRLKFQPLSIATWLFLSSITNSYAEDGLKSTQYNTIPSLETALNKNETSCAQVIEDYITKIKTYDLSNQTAPPLNAIEEINLSARIQAQTLDKYFQKNHHLFGPLHCVPVILKDNVDSLDTTTSAGSYALLGNHPIKDADLVANLRKAGAIIIAKAGMDEFAWGMSGINSRNGRIGNSYNTFSNPGGSSGGTAVAISAQFGLIGIGSDNSGSIRIPAAFNGLIGLRPTMGLISQRGMFPMGNIDGTAGPITENVSDLAFTLDIIANPKLKDKKSYRSYLQDSALNGKRIAIVRQIGPYKPFDGLDKNYSNAINTFINNLKSQGAIIHDITLPDFNNNRDNNQAGEIEDINQYLSQFPAVRSNFKDICLSNRTRNFGTPKECLVFMNQVPQKASPQYNQALATIARNKNYLQQIMQRYHADALVLPLAKTGIATYDSKKVNTWQAPLSSNSGLPAITFPISYFNGMPMAIELDAKAWDEGTLISIAYAYEKKYNVKHRPIILPHPDRKIASMSDVEFNNFIASLGKKIYDEILSHPKKNQENFKLLNAKRFQDILNKIKSD